MKAVLIDGSPAPQSRIGVLLQALGSRLAARGFTVTTVTLQETQLPYNDPVYHNRSDANPSEEVRTFVQRIQAADVIVVGSPLYHGSYSGILKVAIDHLPDDAFTGKYVVLMSNASNVRNAAQAAQALVPVVRALKGEVLTRLVGTYKEDYGVLDGIFQVTASDIIKRLDVVADELAAKVA